MERRSVPALVSRTYRYFLQRSESQVFFVFFGDVRVREGLMLTLAP